MGNLLLVGCGGFLGSCCRYLLTLAIDRHCKLAGLFWGTFTVNLIGCLAIGFLAGFTESRELLAERLRPFLVVGFLGGFTTFSAFGNETFVLVEDGRSWHALANVALNVCVGLAGVWVGYQLGRSQ